MENHSLQKEILVVTSSGYTQNELSCILIDRQENPKNFTEQLEEACWGGFLDNILPPSENKNKTPGKLFIWQLVIGDEFVCADLAEEPFTCDANLSVNPFLFFRRLPCN